MELGNLLRSFRKNIYLLCLVGVLFGFIGVAIYYGVPPRYTATGTFFVKRAIESPSPEFFSYEGYYSQQVSLSYARTFASLLESLDVKSNALVLLGKPISDTTLRRLGRQVRVKSMSPQLVTLSVKANSVGEATNVWAALANAALQASARVNSGGDSLVSVESLSEAPIVQMGYRSVYLNFALGFLFGIILCFFLASFQALLSNQSFSEEKNV